ncbi:branched-chain amino acid ABC transporter permease [Paractinoplanes deccanensis]|uniref:Branched-chain amino acid ABC transporter permease n=1 Tax=Paractinoplanes deccanensis TaxID=113561 RepID=A0ABQ3XX45_9ACTN|nr:branched-chain amino acid ABC transporter permease [Actinoplanes deccanensis]
MDAALSYVLIGVADGSTYAVVGLGISLLYQVTGIINFAQGDFVMLGGLTYAVAAGAGVPMVAAAALALTVTAAVGALVQVAVLAPARKAGQDRLIILTIGASILLQGVALLVFGPDQHFAAPFQGDSQIRVFGTFLSTQYVWCAGATLLAAAAVWALLYRSGWGRAMRATAADREMARLMGLSPMRMGLIAMVIAAVLAGIGGIVLAPLQPPDPTVGVPLGLKGFTAAVLGGLSSPMGAIAGGLIVGVVEAFVTGLVSSGYRDSIVYGLLVLVLLARPAGIVTRRRTERV